MADFSILIRPHDRIILAIREHIGAEEAVGIGGGEGVGVDEPADGRVIIAALEVVEAGLGVVIIAAVTQGVDVGDAGGISEDFRTAVVHCAVAPCIIVVERDHSARRIKDGRHVTLCVDKVIVQLRRRPVLIDHREGLAAVVIDELKSVVIAPSLPHDLAGERRVGIGRITDLLAAADTSHVIGVLHGLAAHDGLCELTPLRPVEMVVTAVVIRDRVAGGREVARLRLPLIQDVLGRAIRRHARKQVRPRGIRVAKGLRDRAVLRNTADVARRIVGAAAQRDAAGNDDDLWLCADGCTHHSDHLSIFLRAVQQHRPLTESPIFRAAGRDFSLFSHSIRDLNTASTMIKIFCSIVTQTSVFHRKHVTMMRVKPFSFILHLSVPIIYNPIRQVAECLSGHVENLICLRREKITFIYLNSVIFVVLANIYRACIVSIIYLYTQCHSCTVQNILL